MDYNQLFLSFDGRINRQTFWVNGVLPLFLIGFVVGLVDVIIGANNILSGLWAGSEQGMS
ncbi:hypothetical protein KFU94_17120 [Chloroflexi bacterium TSY]|nr:hypothetical protein [Chloroflexi bacterium TSY]